MVEARGRMLRDQLVPRLIEEAKANFDAPIYNNPPRKMKSLRQRHHVRKGLGAGEKAYGARGERDAPRGERREGDKFGDKPQFGDKSKGRGDGKLPQGLCG